jgi:CRISPR-associated protein Cas1
MFAWFGFCTYWARTLLCVRHRDLYKAEVTIPIAFEVAAKKPEDVSSTTRHSVRDAISDGHILEQATNDIRRLLLNDEAEDEAETDILHLWDDKNGLVANAVSYGKELDEPEQEVLEDGYGKILGDEE